MPGPAEGRGGGQREREPATPAGDDTGRQAPGHQQRAFAGEEEEVSHAAVQHIGLEYHEREEREEEVLKRRKAGEVSAWWGREGVCHGGVSPIRASLTSPGCLA